MVLGIKNHVDSWFCKIVQTQGMFHNSQGEEGVGAWDEN
jgi:hypothetical protein